MPYLFKVLEKWWWSLSGRCGLSLQVLATGWAWFCGSQKRQIEGGMRSPQQPPDLNQIGSFRKNQSEHKDSKDTGKICPDPEGSQTLLHQVKEQGETGSEKKTDAEIKML